MSFSQFGEDEKIAQCFTHNGVLRSGLALDIGAWGVRDFSNSRLLIEAGWSAVLCEFSPMPVHCLVEEYGKTEYNGRVQIIQAAITCESEHVIEFDITQDALSTNDPQFRARWGTEGGYYGKLWVPTLSVGALLSQFFGDRHIDFASIDTEGTSVDIAIALINTDHRPEVMCVEHDSREAWLMEHAQQHGYSAIWQNSTNIIIARGDALRNWVRQ